MAKKILRAFLKQLNSIFCLVIGIGKVGAGARITCFTRYAYIHGAAKEEWQAPDE